MEEMKKIVSMKQSNLMNIFFNHYSPVHTQRCNTPNDKFITLISPYSLALHLQKPSYPNLHTNSRSITPYKSYKKLYYSPNLLELLRKAEQNCLTSTSAIDQL